MCAVVILVTKSVSPKTVSRARTQEMSEINANISRIRAKKQFLGLTDFGHQYND